MSNIKSEAIVLKSFKYGETSRIVTMFSDELGKFSAVIKGIRNAKSKIGGVFETMNHVNIMFNKKDNRELQFINNADCISSFPKIKDDFDKLMTAYKFSELTNRMMYNYDISREVFDNLRSALYILNSGKTNNDLLFIMYQVKFAVIQGINPVILNDERNFHDGNIVLKDKDMNYSRNLFTESKMVNAINMLYSAEYNDAESIEISGDLTTKIQNAYDYHYMSVAEKYGHNRSRQIIDELTKN